jgi:3'-phosphoadenosine 5'-phosphosulfate (PAPS) 3'-phosphatase
LDGTREFTEGRLEGVTVLIGIATKGNAIGGIIHQPFYIDGDQCGRSVWGLVNSGVYGHRLATDEPLPGRIIAGSLSHSSKTVVDAINACQPTEVFHAGGCGYKVSLD